VHWQRESAGAVRVRLQEPAPAKAGVSIATPATKPKGGQFVLHAKALHGNPFDGHTLGPVITELEQQTGVETRRIHVDKGYRGHNHKETFRVWISGQVWRVTKPIRREMRRRAAVEPAIGHAKAEHRMGRNLSEGARRRLHQCRARRRRLQLRPPPALAGEAFARPLPGVRRNVAECSLGLKTGDQPFFTGDRLLVPINDVGCHYSKAHPTIPTEAAFERGEAEKRNLIGCPRRGGSRPLAVRLHRAQYCLQESINESSWSIVNLD
jgi:hypothetical protein